MKTRSPVKLLSVAVLLVTLVTPSLAIQVCYDYVYYRLRGIDPAPPPTGRLDKPYLSYTTLTDYLDKEHYAPLLTSPGV